MSRRNPNTLEISVMLATTDVDLKRLLLIGILIDFVKMPLCYHIPVFPYYFLNNKN